MDMDPFRCPVRSTSSSEEVDSDSNDGRRVSVRSGGTAGRGAVSPALSLAGDDGEESAALLGVRDRPPGRLDEQSCTPPKVTVALSAPPATQPASTPEAGWATGTGVPLPLPPQVPHPPRKSTEKEGLQGHQQQVGSAPKAKAQDGGSRSDGTAEPSSQASPNGNDRDTATRIHHGAVPGPGLPSASCFSKCKKLPSILMDSWEFRKIASEGSVLPNALVCFDVDDDGVEECIVGTTEGVLLVVKPDCRTPIFTHVLSATISVVLYSRPHHRLVLVTLEGQCEVLEHFLSATKPDDRGAKSNPAASAGKSPAPPSPSLPPRSSSHADLASHPFPPNSVTPAHVFHVPSNCFCGDLGQTEKGAPRIFLGSFDRRMYVYSVEGVAVLSVFMFSPITSIKAVLWTAEMNRDGGDPPASAGARGSNHHGLSRGRAAAGESGNEGLAPCPPIPLVFVATTRTLVLLRAGARDLEQLRQLEVKHRQPLALADADAARIHRDARQQLSPQSLPLPASPQIGLLTSPSPTRAEHWPAELHAVSTNLSSSSVMTPQTSAMAAAAAADSFCAASQSPMTTEAGTFTATPSHIPALPSYRHRHRHHHQQQQQRDSDSVLARMSMSPLSPETAVTLDADGAITPSSPQSPLSGDGAPRGGGKGGQRGKASDRRLTDHTAPITLVHPLWLMKIAEDGILAPPPLAAVTQPSAQQRNDLRKPPDTRLQPRQGRDDARPSASGEGGAERDDGEAEERLTGRPSQQVSGRPSRDDSRRTSWLLLSQSAHSQPPRLSSSSSSPSSSSSSASGSTSSSSGSGASDSLDLSSCPDSASSASSNACDTHNARCHERHAAVHTAKRGKGSGGGGGSGSREMSALLAASYSRLQAESVPRSMRPDGSFRPSLAMLAKQEGGASASGGGGGAGDTSAAPLAEKASRSGRRRAGRRRSLPPRQDEPPRMTSSALSVDTPRPEGARSHDAADTEWAGATADASTFHSRPLCFDDTVALSISLDVSTGARRMLLVASSEDGRAFVMEFSALTIRELTSSTDGGDGDGGGGGGGGGHSRAAVRRSSQASRKKALRVLAAYERGFSGNTNEAYDDVPAASSPHHGHSKRRGKDRSRPNTQGRRGHRDVRAIPSGHQDYPAEGELSSHQEQIIAGLMKTRARQHRAAVVLHRCDRMSWDNQSSLECSPPPRSLKGEAGGANAEKPPRRRRRPVYHIYVPLQRGKGSSSPNGSLSSSHTRVHQGAPSERPPPTGTPIRLGSAHGDRGAATLVYADGSEELVLKVNCVWAGNLGGPSPLVQRSRILRVAEDGFCAVLVAASGTCVTFDPDTCCAVEYAVLADCSSFTLSIGPPLPLALPPSTTTAATAATAATPKTGSRALPLTSPGTSSRRQPPPPPHPQREATAVKPQGDGASSTVLGRAVSCVCVCVDELGVYSIGDAFLSTVYQCDTNVVGEEADSADTPVDRARSRGSSSSQTRTAALAPPLPSSSSSAAAAAAAAAAGLSPFAMVEGWSSSEREEERRQLQFIGAALMRLDGVPTKRQAAAGSSLIPRHGVLPAPMANERSAEERGKEEEEEEEGGEEYIRYALRVISSGYSVDDWNALYELEREGKLY